MGDTNIRDTSAAHSSWAALAGIDVGVFSLQVSCIGCLLRVKRDVALIQSCSSVYGDFLAVAKSVLQVDFFRACPPA